MGSSDSYLMVDSLNYLSVKPVLHNWYNRDGNVLFNVDSVAGDIALVIECFGVSYSGFIHVGLNHMSDVV